VVLRHCTACGSAGRYDRALALKPDLPTPCNRGVVLRAIGHGEQALADFGRALAIKPNFIQALTTAPRCFRT